MTETHLPNLLGDPNATRITAGDTAAEFLPNFGIIGVSLNKDDIEALRRSITSSSPQPPTALSASRFCSRSPTVSRTSATKSQGAA